MKLNSRSLVPNSIDKNPAENPAKIPCTGHHKKWVVETGLRIKVVSRQDFWQDFLSIELSPGVFCLVPKSSYTLFAGAGPHPLPQREPHGGHLDRRPQGATTFLHMLHKYSF